MRSHIKSVLSGLPLFGALATAQWPAPETTKGGNLRGIRDPSLIQRSSDGQYYLFGTNGNGTLHTAPSIYGPWTNHREGALNVSQVVVAPQVYQIDGTYHMYYSQHTGPDTDWYYTANIHVATSETMDPGTWTEHGELGIPLNNAKLANHASNDGYNILDASLLVVNGTAANGSSTKEAAASTPQYYLSFGSYYSGLFQTTLNSPVDLQANTTVDAMNHLELNTTGGHSTEGSFQFAWPTDGSAPTKYYLFFSSGQCCKFKQMGVPKPGDEYKVMVCRSDDPAGPFVDATGKNCQTDNGGTLVLGSHDDVYAPGGQGVLYSDEVDSVVMYYHYTPANSTGPGPNLTIGDNGAVFGWNKMNFDAQGWPVLAGGTDGAQNTTSTIAGAVNGAAVQTSAARRRVSYPWRFLL